MEVKNNTVFVYVCSCGKESLDSEVIESCERGHLTTTIEDRIRDLEEKVIFLNEVCERQTRLIGDLTNLISKYMNM